ncbi:MAG: membrane protein insertion efficiency factor YidD [Rhodobiaceae bacterium]|nr:membrane protein insertion efficiency factor YidD [Rhodobiaceae bacterium]MAU56591.1 membrane protein insertion efficiency factor YidD [Rhodobiaceae bacterium]OUT83347.1 MAG: membrane protein insertion efficiency factor YidD [Rhizobiales bacterium TMED28]RZO32832.1 MAG: membrane protein insertion efficiency factor YidD [Hyphomicrobiales bacterium]|tara:strand:+ start:9623 stop:9910 length:288 start_codon:yes stop_codon:yes gene_type:complete
MLKAILNLPFILLIKIYQYTLSYFLGNRCRYLPTCSNYALEAMQKFGFWAGGWLFLYRFFRCHPLSGHGYDPVPNELPKSCIWYKPWTYKIKKNN